MKGKTNAKQIGINRTSIWETYGDQGSKTKEKWECPLVV